MVAVAILVAVVVKSGGGGDEGRGGTLVYTTEINLFNTMSTVI